MMRRPMVGLGLAYVFGEILVLLIGQTAILLFGVFFAVMILISACAGRIQKGVGAYKKNMRTTLLFCMLPVFMLFGGVRLCSAQQKSEAMWEAGASSMPVTFLCTVEKTEIKPKSVYIYVGRTEAVLDKKTERTSIKPCLPEKLLIVWDGNEAVYAGDRLIVRGSWKRFDKASNRGVYDAWEANSAVGLYGEVFPEGLEVLHRGCRILKGLSEVKKQMTEVYSAVLDERNAGVLCGIMFGDKQRMAPDLKELYQSQGIGHLFAVSGLHMSMAGVGIYKLLRRLTVTSRMAFIVSLALMTAYSFICGTPLSCIRAVLMAGMLMTSEMLGRSYDGLSALALAAVWILWKYPKALTSFGVLMSFGAVGILIGFVPLIVKYGRCKKLSAAIVPTLCVSLFTMPIVSWFLYEIPIYSVILNVLLLSFMGILFAMAAIGGIAGMLWLPAGHFLIGIVYYLLQLYEAVCTIASKLPFSTIVTGRPVWQAMLLGCIIFPALYAAAVKKCHGKTLTFGVICMVLVFWVFGYPKVPSEARIIFIDVGQGDCALVSMPDGTNWMIDGGSSSEKSVGRYTIEKVLKYYGISRLDGAFLSHMDSDHTNGIIELMDFGYPIERLYVPKVCPSWQKLEAVASVAEKNGTKVEVMTTERSLCTAKSTGKRAGTFKWKIECLHPSSDFQSDDDNEASMVLLLYIEDFKFLFTGDAEAGAEAAMLERLPDIHLLKVGHHGSKYSSSAQFLEKVKPETAVISCGRDNRYGHPHDQVLERLKNIGCSSFITAESGAVTVKISHGRFSIQPYQAAKNIKQFERRLGA